METGEDMRIPDVLSGLWNNWKQNVYVETQHKQHVWDTVRKKLFKLTLKYIWKLRLQEENQTAECHLPGAILSELQLVSQETFPLLSVSLVSTSSSNKYPSICYWTRFILH